MTIQTIIEKRKTRNERERNRKRGTPNTSLDYKKKEETKLVVEEEEEEEEEEGGVLEWPKQNSSGGDGGGGGPVIGIGSWIIIKIYTKINPSSKRRIARIIEKGNDAVTIIIITPLLHSPLFSSYFCWCCSNDVGMRETNKNKTKFHSDVRACVRASCTTVGPTVAAFVILVQFTNWIQVAHSTTLFFLSFRLFFSFLYYYYRLSGRIIIVS